MEDRGVVAAIVDGDPRGLAAAYDKYADRLHAFCASMLRDPDAAADALHDTFIVASQRARQLRDPDRFRPWLYAIARNECLRQLRAKQRTTGIEAAGELADESVNLDGNLRAAELRRLIWQAAEGLNPRERAALELSLRHGLEGLDLADALGVTTSHMNTLLTRARHQLERSLTALLVVRTGRGDCAELSSMVAGWDGQLTVLMRKRLSRHIENCPTCAVRRRAEVSATALLATLPVAAAPFGLRRKVLNDVGDVQLIAYRKKISRRAGHFSRSGFPASFEHLRHPVDARQWSAAAVLLGIFALGALLVLEAQVGGADQSSTNAAPGRPGGAIIGGNGNGGGQAPESGTTGKPGSAQSEPNGGSGAAANEGYPTDPGGPTDLTGSGGFAGSGFSGPGTRPGLPGGGSPAGGSPGSGSPSGSGEPTRSPSGSPGGGGSGSPSSLPTPTGQPTRGNPTSTPTPVEGTLVVKPEAITFGTSAVQQKFRIRAKDGRLGAWTASISSGASVLSLNKTSGGPMAANDRVTVKVKLNRAAAAAAGITSGEIVVRCGEMVAAVEVSWQNPVVIQ